MYIHQTDFPINPNDIPCIEIHIPSIAHFQKCFPSSKYNISHNVPWISYGFPNGWQDGIASRPPFPISFIDMYIILNMYTSLSLYEIYIYISTYICINIKVYVHTHTRTHIHPMEATPSPSPADDPPRPVSWRRPLRCWPPWASPRRSGTAHLGEAARLFSAAGKAMGSHGDFWKVMGCSRDFHAG